MQYQNQKINYGLSPELYPISGSMCSYDWWLSRTDNQPSIYSLCFYLVYFPEINMVGADGFLSLSELQSHCQKLAYGLHNHANAEGLPELKKQLENSPYQALLEISETFHHKDIDRLSFQIGIDVFQQYAKQNMVHIPSYPNKDGLEKGMIECRVSPQVSKQVQGPSENNYSTLIVDDGQEFVCMSYFSDLDRI